MLKKSASIDMTFTRYAYLTFFTYKPYFDISFTGIYTYSEVPVENVASKITNSRFENDGSLGSITDYRRKHSRDSK